MTNPNSSASINFQEEFSSKTPALTLLTTLGYQFIPPSQCHAMRSKVAANKATNQVVLLPIMRAFLAEQTFIFEGKPYPLSASAIDKIMHTLNPAMNLGLQAANEALYNAMLYGVTVTEFIDGKRTAQTISLIDWNHISNNAFHFTEEFVVQNSEGTGNVIPDIVCFVNGLPLAVIEAKRPDSNREGQSTNAQAVSQHIRNQGQKQIPHLFAYSQLLLVVNGHDGLYTMTKRVRCIWQSLQDFAKQQDHVLPKCYVSGETQLYLGRRYALKVLIDSENADTMSRTVNLSRGQLNVALM